MINKPYGEDIDAGFSSARAEQWQEGTLTEREDNVIEERPVALVFNGISHAVMMTTPCDLEDFALGFSISEGILERRDQLFDIEVTTLAKGTQVDLSISAEKMVALKQRRRSTAGRTGCGLCGAESLASAIRDGRKLTAAAMPAAAAIQKAVSSLSSWQRIQSVTGACHAAMWCDNSGDMTLLREDVGRHNAFDKLLGAMTRQQLSSDSGFAVISSRASYEMVHKASFLNCSTLVAVSAPTSMAIEQARELNINLIGFARNGRHTIYNRALSGATQSV
ncbi:MAG: formate dehydrogenase accessory sulfurtransferase FdhD [Pseudomonadales bacterium]